eukprot:Skav212526  [mRNA]  locus=scaffold3442:23927:25027:- [translate_table: standard]
MSTTQYAPNYNGLQVLPQRCTMSLWEEKALIYNVDEPIVMNTIAPAEHKNKEWQSLNWEGQWWFILFTKEELNKITNNGEDMVTYLPGNLRVNNGWEQLALLPTTEEAIQFAAYHQSQGHIPCHNRNVILAMKTSPDNLVNHNAMKKTTHFQTGHSAQYLQVHSGYRYKMDPQEIQTTRILELQYNPCHKFGKYNWNNGWMWIYGHAIHITMAQCEEDSPHRTILTQALQHLGQEGMLYFTPEQQATITRVRVAHNMDSVIADRPLDAQRDHPQHSLWIQANNPLTIPVEEEDSTTERGAKRLREDVTMESQPR